MEIGETFPLKPTENIRMDIHRPPPPDSSDSEESYDEECDCAYHRSLREQRKQSLAREINHVLHS